MSEKPFAPTWSPSDFALAKALGQGYHAQFANWRCRAGVCDCEGLTKFITNVAAQNEAELDALPAPDFSLPGLQDLPPTRLPVIGLSGRKRSGKDSVMEVLRAKFWYRNESHAKPLKKALQIIYGWDDRHTDGDLKEVVDPYWGVTPRKVMEVFGTEVGRSIDRTIWIKSLHNRLRMAIEEHKKSLEGLVNPSDAAPLRFVITDVRYPNEGVAVRAMGGVVWRVERPGFSPANVHSSESAMDDFVFDDVLVNDSDLANLASEVEVALVMRVAAHNNGVVDTPNGPRRILT